AALVHEPAASPLPQVLYEEQVQRAIAAARALFSDAKRPDPRPLFLFSLILQTGMKKSECLALQFSHFDLSDPAAPAVFIRYKDPRRRHKERKIALDPALPALLRAYVEAYRPRLALFPCTGRNLEYVLRRIAQLAGLEGGISFETLRWTCALRDYQSGMEPDRLRRKLGLSEIAWEETRARIEALAARPL
ncbi:MAG: site-specific integrase, partial [Anaerolineae bacterium]|nr:site-specific integrase [Anaerolineae bacterium]